MQTNDPQIIPGLIKPHGCLLPLHPFQIMSYILFFFYAYVFYFIELIALKTPAALPYILAVPYTILFILVAITAIIATVTDPTDPTVATERAKKHNKFAFFVL